MDCYDELDIHQVNFMMTDLSAQHSGRLFVILFIFWYSFYHEIPKGQKKGKIGFQEQRDFNFLPTSTFTIPSSFVHNGHELEFQSISYSESTSRFSTWTKIPDFTLENVLFWEVLRVQKTQRELLLFFPLVLLHDFNHCVYVVGSGNNCKV